MFKFGFKVCIYAYMNIRCKIVTQIAFIITKVSISTKFQMKTTISAQENNLGPWNLKKKITYTQLILLT